MADRQAAEARERERTAELVRAGAALQQARWMARQERLDDAEGENEWLWDQADEIAALKSDRDALSVRLAQADRQIATDAHTFREWRRTIERLEVRLAQAEQERDELLGWLRDEEDGYVRQRALRKEAEARLREYEEAAEALLAQDDWTDTVSVSYAAYKRLDALAASGGREAPMTLDEHAERCQVCVPHSHTECDFGDATT